MHERMRSVLFVPGSRPERFEKAMAAGADAVIIDLEDAVEPEAKAAARNHVAAFARANPRARFLVRCNGAETPWFDDDLVLCRSIDGVVAVVLPKAEKAEQVQAVRERTGRSVIPIVESAKGVAALDALAAGEGVLRLAFGYLDLMLDTRTRPGTPGAKLLLDHVRCRMLLASAAAGIEAPLDGVHPDFRNTEAVSSIAIQVRDMGFGGVLCIHPAQVAAVNAVFMPPVQEREWAQRVIAEYERTGSSAFQVDGEMVDAPVIERARRILAE